MKQLNTCMDVGWGRVGLRDSNGPRWSCLQEHFHDHAKVRAYSANNSRQSTGDEEQFRTWPVCTVWCIVSGIDWMTRIDGLMDWWIGLLTDGLAWLLTNTMTHDHFLEIVYHAYGALECGDWTHICRFRRQEPPVLSFLLLLWLVHRINM